MVQKIFFISLMMISILFTACTSSSTRETGSNNTQNHSTIKGVIVDGPIKDAKVCLDVNSNKQCDTNEPSFTTSTDGNFTLEVIERYFGKYKVISIGGTDTVTNEFFDTTLEELVDVKVNKTAFLIITPLTTLSSKIYDEEKSKDPTYSLTKAKEKLALVLGLTTEQISVNPLSDIAVFAKTQQLMQATKLLVIDILEDTTDRNLSKETFDKVFTQLALTINSETNTSDLNVSKLAQDIQVYNPEVSIDENRVSFIQAYSDEVRLKISDANSTQELEQLQNVFDSYTYKVDRVINDSSNVTITLDDILTSIKDTTTSDMFTGSGTIVQNNRTTQKPTIDLDTNSDSGISNTDNITNNTTPVINGTGEVGAEIVIKDDANNTLAQTIVDANGDYTITLNTLTNASYNLRSIAKDDVGNTNTSDVLTLVIDTSELPLAFINLSSASDSGVLNTDNITNDTTPTIVTDINTSINVKDSNLSVVQTLTTESNGTANVATLETLADGIYLIENTTVDISGNTTGEHSLSITIDSTPPVFTVNSSDNNVSTTEHNVSITQNDLVIPDTQATDVHGISYSISGKDSSYFKIDTVTGKVELVNTSNKNSVLSFNVDAVDIAGNHSSQSFNVVLTVSIISTTDKFGPSNGFPTQWFGKSISMYGDYIVVGSDGDDVDHNISATAYLYKIDEDNRAREVSKIIPSDSSFDNGFGHSVSMYGSYIIVGANKESSLGVSAGAAYVFKINTNDTVTQIAKLTASDTNAYDLFGSSVSISKNYIVVGSEWKEKFGINKVGAAYLFQINGDDSVTELSRLTASDTQLSDYFGHSVSISDDYIMVGANGEDSGGSNAGAVYVFKKDINGTVSEISKITASDALPEDMFGSAVSISGDNMIIGAHGKDGENEGQSNLGAAYIFKRYSDSNVSQVLKLTSTDAQTNDMFGSSVTIYGNYLAVGAYGENNDTGAVYLYKQKSDNTASKIFKLSALDSKPDQWFGSAVSIYENKIAIGSSKKGIETGSAYLFDMYADLSDIYIDRPYLPTLESNIDLYESSMLSQYALYPVSNSAGVSFKVSGDDGDKFTIQNNVLKAVSALDYENPNDLNLDNNYSIKIELTDSNNRVNSYDTTISIKNTTYLNKAKLIASDAKASDRFGASVCVDGDYIAIGAKEEDGAGDNAGAVYLFKKEVDNSVTELVKLTASDAQDGDMFGSSVSIYGDYIIVGSSKEDEGADNAGAVYVFKRKSDTDIVEISKLTASDAVVDAEFGNSVSMSGDYMIVGAVKQDSKGAAYMFKRNNDDNISEVAKLTASDGLIDDMFGHSVSIAGDYIVVGANGEDSIGADSGATYMFKRQSDNNVTEISKLTSQDAQAEDMFGSCVSISGDYIVIGADAEDTGGSDAGAAYVFKRQADDNITQVAKLISSDIKPVDNFGNSVSISGNNILVGAKGKDEFGNESGSAYLYEIGVDSSVLEVSKIVGSDIQNFDFFGSSVSISGNNIVVGAEQYKLNTDKSGVAYLFTPDENQ